MIGIRNKGNAIVEHLDGNYEDISWSPLPNSFVEYKIEFRDQNGYLRASKGNSVEGNTSFEDFELMLDIANKSESVREIKLLPI